jgi:hypothetical protein
LDSGQSPRVVQIVLGEWEIILWVSSTWIYKYRSCS